MFLYVFRLSVPFFCVVFVVVMLYLVLVHRTHESAGWRNNVGVSAAVAAFLALLRSFLGLRKPSK